MGYGALVLLASTGTFGWRGRLREYHARVHTDIEVRLANSLTANHGAQTVSSGVPVRGRIMTPPTLENAAPRSYREEPIGSPPHRLHQPQHCPGAGLRQSKLQAQESPS